MAKHQLKKNEIINSRITILFFHTLLIGAVLWAENFARYRYDYILRGMLPWLLPAALLCSIGVLGILIYRYFKQKQPREGAIFSLPFGIYMAIPFPAAFLFPWLTLFGKGLQLYKLAVLLVFLGVIGYFIAYVLYHKVRPAAALLAWEITANALALTYFYRMYLSPSRYILLGEEFGYLPIWSVALILCGLIAVALLITLVLAKNKAFSLRSNALLLPAALSVVLLLATTFLDAWLSGLWIRILIFGGIGLMVLWLIIQCVLLKLKKN